MKLLIISQYYYPEQFLINEISPELAKDGHEVTVLTGLPNYPVGKIYDGYTHKEKRVETIKGVKVIRCFEIGRHHSPVTLILNYISYMFSASMRVCRINEKFDAVFVYQLSPVTMAMPAIKLKKKQKIPILLYCLDLWPESAKAHMKNENGVLYKAIQAMSKKIYESCDKIAVTSLPFVDYLHREHSVEKERCIYLPQHADDKYLSLDLDSENNGIADFMYAGNLGAGQRVDVIIRAAAMLRDRKDFLIHIVGYGSQYAELTELAQKLNISDRIIFYGQQRSVDMPSFYKKADVLLLTLRGNNFVGNTMPGKLQTYMTTGKPILGAINGASQQVIRESGAGKCVDSGDYKGLAGIMLEYIEHPSDFQTCGAGAKKYFEKNFTKKIFMERLECELQNLIKHS